MNTTFTRGWSLEAKLVYWTDLPSSLFDCWPWQGFTITGGYGRVKYRGTWFLVHRASFKLFVGPVPKGLDVLHSCDNPPCWNPLHLWAGTDRDNMDDCMSKHRHAVGSRIGMSKLTEADIVRIRQDTRTIVAIGNDYGVHHSQISRIRNGERWKHVL